MDDYVGRRLPQTDASPTDRRLLRGFDLGAGLVILIGTMMAISGDDAGYPVIAMAALWFPIRRSTERRRHECAADEQRIPRAENP